MLKVNNKNTMDMFEHVIASWVTEAYIGSLQTSMMGI